MEAKLRWCKQDGIAYIIFGTKLCGLLVTWKHNTYVQVWIIAKRWKQSI